MGHHSVHKNNKIYYTQAIGDVLWNSGVPGSRLIGHEEWA